MYELFYSFLIEELLYQFFKNSDIEIGEKYYLIIEDASLRQGFVKALHDSEFTQEKRIEFSVSEKYSIAPTPYDTVVFKSNNSEVDVLVSSCDETNDGFQTMIRNSVGVPGNPVSNMAALFILPGTNAIETLLSAGQNLQEAPCPLCLASITAAIKTKVGKKINEIERAYLQNYIKTISNQDEYSSLFDFAPVLSVLQRTSMKGSYSEIDAFEDNEIYDSSFTSSNINERVRDNAEAYSVVSEAMGEVFEQEQYKKLCKYLDSTTASKISSGKVNWKELDYKVIRASHIEFLKNAVLLCPDIKCDSDAEIVINSIKQKNEKKSRNYVIICDPSKSAKVLKASFNKDLRDYSHTGDAKVSGAKLSFPLNKFYLKDKIGDDKNNHEISILYLQTKNIFHQIEHVFKIDSKGRILVELPESMGSITLGSGEKALSFDKVNPIEIDDSSSFTVSFDLESEEEILVPFKFGDQIVKILFKFSGERTETVTPRNVGGTIWGEGGTFTYDGGETISGPNGPVYIHGRLRNLINIEKYMIDKKVNHIILEKDEFEGNERITSANIDIDPSISNTLLPIFSYFEKRHSVPTLLYPDEELKTLYQAYIDSVHFFLSSIQPGRSLSECEKNLAKLGVVENDDQSIYLSPFHPLMVSYALQMRDSIDREEFDVKVLEELSPMYLLPYVFYGKNAMKAINTTETEDIFTWVKYDLASKTQQVIGSRSISKLVTDKIQNFISVFNYYFPDNDCPIRISAIGLSKSVDLVRGIVSYLAGCKSSNNVQRIEIHEYVDDLLTDTFFEQVNRLSSRDSISELFERHNFNVSDDDLNEVIRLLFSRVSYYKHTFKNSRRMSSYSHITFYKIDSGMDYSPLPSNQLRTEAALSGLVSIPSTNLIEGKYLMGYGTKGLKDLSKPIYQMADDMNSLYAGLCNGGLAAYSRNQCTAKVYSFNDSDFLENVYENSTWVTFLNPEVDIDFFYKQNLYVVHYVEQHSLTTRLESITVTKHISQYNKMLFNSLQKFKAIIGTSDEFSRKMINYFNCLNGKWLLGVINKPELIIREKMSLVATCFVMQHFLRRTDGIIWIPIATDEIIKATGSIGSTTDGLFSKKDLGLEGPLSDDILMVGLKCGDNRIALHFYPVEVKVLSDDSVGHGEIQVANLYSKALERVLFTGDSFHRKVYRLLFASHFLSNAEKMRANSLIEDADYRIIDSYRSELLNVDFDVVNDLPEEIGKAALVVYSDATAKTITTQKIDDVPVCHIRMMEEDCYSIVSNPESDLLEFVEKSAITISSIEITSEELGANIETESISENQDETPNKEEEQVKESSPVSPLDNDFKVSDPVEKHIALPSGQMLIKVGTTKKGLPVTIEPNNPTVVSHPNIGVTGIMGTGKTQLVRSIISQFSKESKNNVGNHPIGMLVFDYKGDYNDDSFIDEVKGTSTFYDIPFNPLKLLKTKKNIMQNLPAITAEAIADSLTKAFGAGSVQRAKIKQVILEAYESFGITADYKTWDIPAPTLNDVINRYLEQYDATDTVYSYFSSLNNYRIFSSNNEECVSIFEWLDRVRVIDLTEINSDSVKRVIVSLILDILNKEMLLLGPSSTNSDGKRELRAMIVVDEAHQFLQRDFNAMEQILRQGRAFGVGMILSTQNIGDFKTKNNDYSNYVASWILHHVNSVSKQELVSVFGATDKNIERYMDYINNAQIFESLSKIGVDRIQTMRDYPYFELIKHID